MTRAIGSLALLFLIPLALAAQEPPTAGASIDVSIVNVDVVVTDRQGNRVRGLTGADFEVYENGVRQEVSNFAEYAAAPEAGRVGVEGSAPAAEVAPPEKRTVMVFFERMRLPIFHADPLIEELKSSVRQMLGPGDEVSLVVWSRYGGIAHIELTSDLAAFERALDIVGKVVKGAQIDHTSALRDDVALVRQFEEGMAQMASSIGTTPASASNIDTSAALLLPMMMAYNEMKVRTAAINSAINSMSGMEGKKVLILATRRLGEVAGAEFAYAGGAMFIAPDLKQRFGAEGLIQSIIDNANASRVTIYPIYPIGLGSGLPDASSSLPQSGSVEYLTLQNEKFSLNRIAKATGGLMAASAKDAVHLMPRIASDMTDYYSLAYRITPSNSDTARNIVVKTRREGLTVRSRGQFVEKSDDTRMRDRVVAALFQGSPDSQIGIRATLGKRQKNRGTEILPVSIRVPIADLTTLPEGDKHAGSFAVYVAAAADLNELSDITERKQAFELKESQLAAARTGFFTYDLDVAVNRKAKYVAVGVFDEVGRSYGLVRLNLEDRK